MDKNDNFTFYGKSLGFIGNSIKTVDTDFVITMETSQDRVKLKTKDQTSMSKMFNKSVFVKLPQNLLKEKGLFDKKFISFAFKNDKNFRKRQDNIYVGSSIFSLSFINTSINNLDHPLEMSFEINNNTSTSAKRGSCSFWVPGNTRE